MKILIIVLLVPLTSLSFNSSQKGTRITTIDFVQILNGNSEETTYYYENNWKLLRDKAVKKGYIESFQLLETPFSEDAPFHIMLITTYPNQDQYDLREDNFAILIEEKGPRRLLNDKQPSEFRKLVFSKEEVKHRY